MRIGDEIKLEQAPQAEDHQIVVTGLVNHQRERFAHFTQHLMPHASRTARFGKLLHGPLTTLLRPFHPVIGKFTRVVSAAKRQRADICQPPLINNADAGHFGIVRQRQRDGLVDCGSGILRTAQTREDALEHDMNSFQEVGMKKSCEL